MLFARYPQLAVLCSAQALYWCCSIIGITLTALVGQQLAPVPWLATLPLAVLACGTLLSVSPLARRMQHLGWRKGLQMGAGLGIAGGLVCTAGIVSQQFVLFCVGTLCIGAYQASAGFYRFAALESVPAPLKGRATAWVVAGGMVAALVAPTMALATRNLLATPMAGAYVCISVLAAVALALLQWLPAQAASPASSQAAAPVTRQALWQRAPLRYALCLTACGQGLMVLLMNATPLAMQHHGHALAVSAQVIQWHVLGMFAPSLVAGPALDRFGARPVAWAGVLCLGASAATALLGGAQLPFLLSSMLLGIGWNLVILAGTTMLGQAYAPAEKATAQSMMEWSNGAMATLMSFGSGALIQTLGWSAINWAVFPVLACMVWWLSRRAALVRPAAA